MSTIFWPEDLPQKMLRDDYTHATGNNVIRADMEYGPAKTRRRSSAAMSARVWTFVLNREHTTPDGLSVDQKTLLEDFLNVVEGLSFWFPDPENAARYILVRVRPKSETAGVELAPDLSSLWRATLNVEVWPNAFRNRA